MISILCLLVLWAMGITAVGIGSLMYWMERL